MRATLEQLKAMGDRELCRHWMEGQFPFDLINGCRHCLMQHHSVFTSRCKEHADVTREVGIVGWGGRMEQMIRPHLEALYALRLFFDSLYPQTVEAAPVTVHADEKTIAESEPSLVAQG